ncbi:MAG: Lrp/AsnC ligand binding domain-containing protein [Rhodospirillaceae bacterium]|nr:Lrp/AsnC ligand binding domain-containing protein [Rhodospirillaceae bacterium]
MPPDRTIDQIDRRILDELAAHGRVTVTELARRVGLTKSPCQARMRRLEETGIIRGYRAILDAVSLGAAHIAFVQVKLDDTTAPALAAFNQAARAVPEIEECHMIAGSFDYLLKVRTRDISAYRAILGQRLSALPHVAQTSTFVAMEAVKDRGP